MRNAAEPHPSHNARTSLAKAYAPEHAAGATRPWNSSSAAASYAVRSNGGRDGEATRATYRSEWGTHNR